MLKSHTLEGWYWVSGSFISFSPTFQSQVLDSFFLNFSFLYLSPVLECGVFRQSLQAFCPVLWWLGCCNRAHFLLAVDSHYYSHYYLDFWLNGRASSMCLFITRLFFLSFKQFARCLCSISTLGAEHSSHWGSWPLVSRGVVKKTFLAWEMKSKTLGEAWFLGVARVLFEGLSLRVSVVDIILCLYWKPSQSGPGLPDFQNNDEGGVGPYRAGV